jgi:hypothetical protein
LPTLPSSLHLLSCLPPFPPLPVLLAEPCIRLRLSGPHLSTLVSSQVPNKYQVQAVFATLMGPQIFQKHILLLCIKLFASSSPCFQVMELFYQYTLPTAASQQMTQV